MSDGFTPEVVKSASAHLDMVYPNWKQNWNFYGGDTDLCLSIQSQFDSSRFLAQFHLQYSGYLPYLISGGMYITEELRHTGVTKILLEAKKKIAREMGKDGLIAAVRADYFPELANLFKQGWVAHELVPGVVGRGMILFTLQVEKEAKGGNGPA